MKINNTDVQYGGLFKLKGKDWLEKQRVAGKVAARTLLLLEQLVKEKTTLTTLQLSKLAEEFILDNKCTPTFKNYKGFPEAVCISVNKELVHGIPKDYTLQKGDLVSFDLGTTYQGAIADTALTVIYDDPTSKYNKLIEACNKALMEGINAVKVGSRLGCVGYAVSRSAKRDGFVVVNNYGGHGLSWDEPHSSPFIENKGSVNEGFRLQPGFTGAIEPMLLPTNPNSRVASDGWTVLTQEIGTHFEHSFYLHEDHVEIITDRTGL